MNSSLRYLCSRCWGDLDGIAASARPDEFGRLIEGPEATIFEYDMRLLQIEPPDFSGESTRDVADGGSA